MTSNVLNYQITTCLISSTLIALAEKLTKEVAFETQG
jgi:hypothetical protein